MAKLLFPCTTISLATYILKFIPEIKVALEDRYKDCSFNKSRQ